MFCRIWIDIVVCLFLVVVNFWVCVIGIVVLCGMIFFIKLFIVLILSESGIMFNNNIFVLGLLLIKIFVWMVVLRVIILFGLIDVNGVLLKNLFICLCINGMWVELLIIMILWIFLFFMFVFFNVWW